MKFFTHILNYIYPPRCVSCSELMQENGKFCGSCWSQLNFITKPYCRICCFEFSFDPGEGNDICLKCNTTPPSYNFARSVLRFDEHSKKLIHNLKYHDSTFVATNFAKIIVNMYKHEISDADYIIPVPMHKWKRVFRLYNQAQILASEIMKEIGVKMLPDVLIKTKHTKSQTGLSKSQRQKNLKGSIIAKGSSVKGKKVILVDDVMTTGSTVDLCAAKLKKIGVKEVVVVCIARTLI